MQKVVIHKPSTTEMHCQQIGLHLVRVQSELVCSINLSHLAYKDSNYFVNNKKFIYIFCMKENYTSKKTDISITNPNTIREYIKQQ